MGNNEKIYYLKDLYEMCEKCLVSHAKNGIECEIKLHNRKSCNTETIYATIVLPIKKAYEIFGDTEILYPQIVHNENKFRFGIVK